VCIGQVAARLFEWLSLFWLLSLTAWAAALLAFHLARSGRLELPWLRMVPAQGAGDIETGVPLIRIVDGVLERR
jgi:hypothetical protein